jgi:hypothetical protein
MFASYLGELVSIGLVFAALARCVSKYTPLSGRFPAWRAAAVHCSKHPRSQVFSSSDPQRNLTYRPSRTCGIRCSWLKRGEVALCLTQLTGTCRRLASSGASMISTEGSKLPDSDMSWTLGVFWFIESITSGEHRCYRRVSFFERKPIQSAALGSPWRLTSEDEAAPHQDHRH